MIQSLLPTQKPPKGVQLRLGDWSTKGLVGFWPFNDEPGGRVFDLSGNGNDGTRGGTGTIWAPGKFGYATKLNGSDDYWDLGTKATLNTPYITVVVWLKPDDATPATNIDIVHRENASAGTFLIRLGTAGNFSSQFRPEGDEGNPVQIATAEGLATLEWQQIVATYDGANFNLFVNGQLKATAAQAGTIDVDSFTSYAIGRHPSPTNYFAGLINHILIFNRALTLSEIALLYREPFRAVTPEWMSVFELPSQSVVGATMVAHYYRHLLAGVA